MIVFLDKCINFIIKIILILIMLFGLYALYDTFQVYEGAILQNDILKLKPEGTSLINMEELHKINKDICGWIRINNTNIDYPVLKGKTNESYLSKNYKKEFSTSGSIFLDYRNNKEFKDKYSVIYGHNMKSSQMFSDLKKFENKEFFDNNPTGFLYVDSKTYEFEILAYGKLSAFSEAAYNVKKYKKKENNDIIEYMKKEAKYKRDLKITEKDRLILLSTCDGTGGNDRAVLLVKIYD